MSDVKEEGSEARTVRSDKTATRRIPAGITDAAFASLGTFAAGLSAVTLFSDVDRGVYALFFAAFGLGVVLSWNLILIPAEVNAVSFAVPDRMRRARETLPIGLLMSIVGASAIFVAALLGRSLTDSGVLWGLTITAVLATVLSPLQDHMRRLLHISELSWRAATVSIVQFVCVIVTLAIMYVLDAPVAVMPFGSLAIANAVSFVAALVMGGVFSQTPLPDKIGFWALARDGKWLLASTLVPSIAHFLVATIIVALAGSEVLGYTEAARVVAQPVLVFATGLTAVLAPKSMRAAMEVDRPASQRTKRVYLLLTMLLGIVYLLVASTDWLGNPMGYIVPAAYVVPWLVATMVFSNLLTASLYLDTNELLGAHMARKLSVVSIILSPILVVVAFTAGTTGAYARPLGAITRSVIQIGWYRNLLNRYYATAKPSVDTTIPSVATDQEG